MMNSKKLENKIKDTLPRLKELTKGCLLGQNGEDADIEVVNTDKEVITYIDTVDMDKIIDASFEQLDTFIIGHPIKLNDVLEWCSLKTTNFFIEDGKAYFATNYMDNNEERFYWNLSSVFLADQSDELKEFLNGL